MCERRNATVMSCRTFLHHETQLGFREFFRRNGGVAGTGCFHSCKIVSRKQLAKDDLRRAALHTLNVEKTHDNQNGEVVR